MDAHIHKHEVAGSHLQEEREITETVSDEIKLHFLGKGKKYPRQVPELFQFFPVFIIPMSPAILHSGNMDSADNISSCFLFSHNIDLKKKVTFIFLRQMEVFKTHVRVFVLYTLFFYMAHSRSAGPTTAFQYNVFCASPFHVLQTQERWL